MESCAAGGSFFMKPGRRKVAGDMLLEARIPLQPAPSASKATRTAARNHFQFHFTGGTIEAVKGLAIMNSGRFWLMLVSTMRRNVGCAFVLAAIAVSAAPTDFASRCERAFTDSQVAVRNEPSNRAALTQLARAAFDWADFPHKDEERAAVADAGIEAARKIIGQAPTNAAAHYWLAMNLGQLARTKSLGALKLVREMEQELSRAQLLDAHVDFAGPDRSLGLLYRDAPGWPASIGSKKKALEHLQRAARLHPEFPDNQLALAESFQQWGEKSDFQRQLKVAERIVNEAREKFTGQQWEQSWADWEKRIRTLKSKNEDSGGHGPPKDDR